MSLDNLFTGKKILITGGTRGLGRQLVQQFHDYGAHVYTVARNLEGIQKLREELPNVRAEVADLNDWQETRKVVESFGPMDCLVNNAVQAQPTPFLEVTEESAKSQLNVNIVSCINISQVVAKGMIQRGTGGTIVNMSSVLGRRPIPLSSIYSATKAALESLTRSMALELGEHNIRVNTVTAGVLNGGLITVDVLGPELFKWFEDARDNLIIKKFIEMKEVGQLVAFLLSPLSSMVVGQSYVVDAGYLCV